MVNMKIKIKNATVRKDTSVLNFNEVVTPAEVDRYYAPKLEQARNEGIAKGRQEALQKLETAFKAIENTLEALKKVQHEIAKKYEPQVIDFALRATEKMVGELAWEGKAKLAEILTPIIDELPNVTSVTIKLHPDDYEKLNQFNQTFLASKNHLHAKMLPDANITPGGVFLETNVGVVDATIETRLKNLYKGIKEQ